jgi:hypothetical protein
VIPDLDDERDIGDLQGTLSSRSIDTADSKGVKDLSVTKESQTVREETEEGGGSPFGMLIGRWAILHQIFPIGTAWN